MDGPAVHASQNAQIMRARALRGVVIGLAAAVVLAVLGAMNTDEAPLPYRLLYWAAVILPGSLLGIAVQTAIIAWGGLVGRRWTEIAVVAVLVSVPHTFLVIVATALFFGLDAITPRVVLVFGITVLMVALVLTAINHLAATAPVAGTGGAGPAPPPAPGAITIAPAPASSSAPAEAFPPAAAVLPGLPPVIAEKLPARLREGRLIAIEAEDHYLRIHTDAGSDLVLMRMGDACALLDAVPGSRVHRSWWVARSAVEGRGRQAGKVVLTLAGGLSVPVSRAMQAVLREEGWG